jgi:Ca2+-binding RTX toxin-like protein
MLGSDLDTDVRLSRATRVTISGGAGDDFLSGRGGNPTAPAPSTVPVALAGGAGNDTVVDGLAENDDISGGSGDDFLFSNDGRFDFVTGDAGFDRATVDTEDGINGTANAQIESFTLTAVGRLHLAPGVLKAQSGKSALLTMSWKTPKSWRELRKVELSLYRGGKAVGTIDVRPGRGRLSGSGAVRLMPGSTLSHRGRTVTAKLALRLPKSLAGEYLRVDVQATDTHGHRQLEPGAGLIRVR